jgi:hypothetical protein
VRGAEDAPADTAHLIAVVRAANRAGTLHGGRLRRSIGVSAAG